MEDRAIERLTDLYEYWMPQVTDTTTYPVDCVFTQEELDTIDRYRCRLESMVSEQEGCGSATEAPPTRSGPPTARTW